MGNIPGCSPSVPKSQSDLLLNDYTLAQERNDDRFGHIYLMRSKTTSHTVLVKDRQVNLSESGSSELAKRLEISNDYLLKIEHTKELSNSEYQIYFEDFSTDLEKEIQRHLEQRTRFPEGELYSILYCTIAALAALESKGVAHQLVIPPHILKITREVYKIHDNFLLVNQSSIYQHALKGEWVRYLAPELFESWSQQKPQPPNHDASRADVFALGVAILDAGLLNREGDFVNSKLNIIDEIRLKEKIKQFRDIYSSSLSRVLEDMLAIDPSRRPNPNLLFKRLPGKPVTRGHHSSGKKKRFTVDEFGDSPEKQGTVYTEITTEKFESEIKQTPQERQLKSSYVPPPSSTRDVNLGSINVSSSIKNDPILSQFLKKIYTGSEEPVNIIPSETNKPSYLASSSVYTGISPEVQRIIAPYQQTNKTGNFNYDQALASNRKSSDNYNPYLQQTPGKGNSSYLNTYDYLGQTRPLSTSGVLGMSSSYNFTTTAIGNPVTAEDLANTNTDVPEGTKNKLDQIFLRAINRTNENLRKSQELSSLVQNTLPSSQNLRYDRDFVGKDWRISNNTYFDGTGNLRGDGQKNPTDTDREIAKLKEDIAYETRGVEEVKQNLFAQLDQQDPPKKNDSA